MGSIICHNLKSNNNQQLAQLIQQRSQQQKYSQNLDLPYRHYIHKNIYIPSALPNSFQHYIPRRKLIIAPSIQQSSIMQRRNRAQLTDMFKITKQMEIDLLGR